MKKTGSLAFALYITVAAIQFLVLALFILNINAILATTTGVYHGPATASRESLR